MLRCPTCGTRLEISEALMLPPRQRRIRDLITELVRNDRRGTASSQAIAVQLGVSVATVKNELHQMEHLGIVCRPAGRKSGWALRKATLTVIKAA